MSYDLTRGQTHSHTHLQAHAQTKLKYSGQDINFHKHVDPINVSTPLVHQEKHMNNDISPSNIEMYNLLSCLFAFFCLSNDWYHIQSGDEFSYLKVNLSQNSVCHLTLLDKPSGAIINI